jgi:hypothetical protein
MGEGTNRRRSPTIPRSIEPSTLASPARSAAGYADASESSKNKIG